jgi:hypothetical protein
MRKHGVMISFKQYIQESDGDKSFMYFKSDPKTLYSVRFDIDFKGEKLPLSANIEYQVVYKIPLWNGDVDFANLENKIKINDIHVNSLHGLHQSDMDENFQVRVYAPFKNKKTESEKKYIESLFVHYFVEGIKDGSIVEPAVLRRVAERAQVELQRKRGNNIL